MPVASRIVDVCAAAHVSATSGSSACVLGRHRRRRDLRVGQDDVLARPERVEPRGLGGLRGLDQLVGPGRRAHVDGEQPEPH